MSNLDKILSCLIDEKVLIGLTAVATGVVVKLLSRSKPPRPPGPTVWPIIGTLPALRNDFLVFKELADKYGDIFYVQLGLFGHQPTVVLNSIELVREALLRKQDDFAGRYRTYTIDVISANGSDIPFGDFNATWRLQRKTAHAALRKFATGVHFQELLGHTIDIVSEIFRQCSGQVIDIHNPVSLVFYNIIASMCFGKKYELNDPEFNRLRQLVDELNASFTGLPLADLWPVMRHLPSQMLRIIRRNMAAIEKFIDGIIHEHRETFDINDVRDLTYYYIQTANESRGQSSPDVTLEHVHIQQSLLDMFSAGTDTSRLTLTWALLFLAAHPEIQQKAQQEIDERLGKDVTITTANRVMIPYCEAIIYETLRLRLPAPLALPHKTTCDTSVGGYRISKGTQILVNLVSLHMDAREWNNPEKFDPDRFIDADGNLAPKPNSFLPFSTGRRQCVGEALAKTSLHVILGTLLQRFTFLPPPGEKVDVTFKKSILAYFANNTKLVIKER